jgi:hypothetical protein
MRADFSRLRFERNKHYTSVLEQQGRVALDADHNEQRAIDEYLRGTTNTDIIGPFGGPLNNAGFAITVEGNTIKIGAGHYYVHGLVLKSDAKIDYGSQPLLIHPAAADSDMLAALARGATGPIQVFLEVWRRLVIALDDPCLREPALGQADTTARLQTVWRVVAQAAPAPPKPTTPGTPVAPVLPANLGARTLAREAVFRRAGTILGSNPAATPAAELPVEALLGLEIPVVTVGGTTIDIPPTAFSPATGAAGAGTTAPPTASAPLSCCDQMYQPVNRPAPGKLSAQTTGGSSDCSCQPTPAAGYRGLENQLYRVEIHQGGDETAATFKWSRENGSVVAAVTGVSGADVVVESLGPDANLGFQSGQWVELSDDSDLFGPIPNQPGALFQIKSITPETNTISMTGPVTSIDPARNARLRRWEQSGAAANSTGIRLSVNSWIDLENGIQVRFAAGQFQSSDHWLIPARTATGQIEWPPCGSDGAAFQPPHRVEVIRAPLACIHFDNTQKFVVEDCRRFFPPLTSVAGGAFSTLNVTKISWGNDDILPFDQLLANGLTVTLDQAPTSRIDAATFSLTLEVPVASPVETSAVQQGFSPIVLRTSMLLDGQITVKDTDINWNLPFRGSKGEIPGIQLEALVILDLMLLQGLSYSSFARVRTKLSGADIFAGTGSDRVFLDGRALGTTGTRADGVTPRIDLALPSGTGSGTSDFESWFYLAPTLTLTGLSVQPSTIVLTPTAPAPPANPVATLTVNYPPVADTVVALSVISPAGTPAGGGVTVPASITVPKGKISVTFPVTVRNTKVGTTLVFQIVASLNNALRFTGTQSANLTVTGFQVIT